MLKSSLAFILLLVSVFVNGQTTTIFGHRSYTRLETGNLNILFTVPHDGELRPTNIPNRILDNGQPSNFPIDFNTRTLARAIAAELNTLFIVNKRVNLRPFILYNELHRIKMDPNRSENECCFRNNDDAFIAYNDFHNFIDNNFKRNFILNGPYQQGLIIDIHGQSHRENWVELGYSISARVLNAGNFDRVSSSLNHLASTSRVRFEELLRGRTHSLGGIMESKFGIKAVPSPRFPSPGTGNYFPGGFIIQRHGVMDSGRFPVSSIQIEFPQHMRSNTNIAESARQVAASLYDFYHINLFDRRK